MRGRALTPELFEQIRAHLRAGELVSTILLDVPVSAGTVANVRRQIIQTETLPPVKRHKQVKRYTKAQAKQNAKDDALVDAARRADAIRPLAEYRGAQLRLAQAMQCGVLEATG